MSTYLNMYGCMYNSIFPHSSKGINFRGVLLASLECLALPQEDLISTGKMLREEQMLPFNG